MLTCEKVNMLMLKKNVAFNLTNSTFHCMWVFHSNQLFVAITYSSSGS